MPNDRNNEELTKHGNKSNSRRLQGVGNVLQWRKRDYREGSDG